ncbi:sodium/potassium-transporting ATPase subunit beta [Drosophila tropicalis]|uniref:sodium/potassium-transporting ATPase subunit beta n=1 Tax=Drosophila tropicalis TaxID=46794 RepID=UPI0035AC0764
MPEDAMVPSGNYKVRKRFRNEEHRRRKKDMPWTKHILNLNENQLFGRTAWAWCRIVSFYLVLYFLIFLILLCLYLIFRFYMVQKGRPSILKEAPGLSIVPGNSSTITFYYNQMPDIYPLCDRIEEFLDKLDYEAEEYFHECNGDKLWGYNQKKPCVFVKLNKIFGFKAEVYTSPTELPSDAPPEVTTIMNQFTGHNRIWLTCELSHGDKPKIVYIPGPYFDSDELEGVNRVVALQLTEMPDNTEIFISCRVWAKNIEVDLKEIGKGNAKFSMKMKVKKSNNNPTNNLGPRPTRFKVWNPNKDQQLFYDEDLQLPDMPDLEAEDNGVKTDLLAIPTEPPDKLKR